MTQDWNEGLSVGNFTKTLKSLKVRHSTAPKGKVNFCAKNCSLFWLMGACLQQALMKAKLV